MRKRERGETDNNQKAVAKDCDSTAHDGLVILHCPRQSRIAASGRRYLDGGAYPGPRPDSRPMVFMVLTERTPSLLLTPRSSASCTSCTGLPGDDNTKPPGSLPRRCPSIIVLVASVTPFHVVPQEATTYLEQKTPRLAQTPAQRALRNDSCWSLSTLTSGLLWLG